MEANSRKTNIREYVEEMPVIISDWQETDREENPIGEKRVVISALNEGGYNGTLVDLCDVISWVRVNMPELLEDG